MASFVTAKGSYKERESGNSADFLGKLLKILDIPLSETYHQQKKNHTKC